MSTQPRFSPKVVKCRQCPGLIVFLQGPAGRLIPCETKNVEAGDFHFDSTRHTRHVDVNGARR